jgi:hypothetical protein
LNGDIPWEQGLATDLCPFQVRFRIDSQSGDYDADEPMFELWEKYRRSHTEHVKEFAKRLVALYRGVTWLPGMAFSADRPKMEILKLTKRGTIIVYRTELQGQKYYSLEARFQLMTSMATRSHLTRRRRPLAPGRTNCSLVSGPINILDFLTEREWLCVPFMHARDSGPVGLAV